LLRERERERERNEDADGEREGEERHCPFHIMFVAVIVTSAALRSS